MWNITVAAYPNLQVTLTVIKKLPLSNLRSNNHPNLLLYSHVLKVTFGMKWLSVWNTDIKDEWSDQTSLAVNKIQKHLETVEYIQ